MITFDNWRLASDGAVLAMQYDNMSRLLEVLGDIPEGWTWTMLVSVGDALDVISMSEVPGGLEAVLTAETLALSGYYAMQLKAVQGDVVRHTNVIRVPVQNSLSGDAQWPTLPTEFSQAGSQSTTPTRRSPAPMAIGCCGTSIWTSTSRAISPSPRAAVAAPVMSGPRTSAPLTSWTGPSMTRCRRKTRRRSI